MRRGFSVAGALGLAVLALTVTGCRGRDDGESQADPFEITFVRGASWTEGHEGYDPELPGYHLTGDIACIRIRPVLDELPATLVLAIRTSPGMRPNLESFLLECKGKPDTTGLSHEERKGPFYRKAVVGKDVQVTFTALGMAMLSQECEVSWIDWLRG